MIVTITENGQQKAIEVNRNKKPSQFIEHVPGTNEVIIYDVSYTEVAVFKHNEIGGNFTWKEWVNPESQVGWGPWASTGHLTPKLS